MKPRRYRRSREQLLWLLRQRLSCGERIAALQMLVELRAVYYHRR
jgi:hypothetical protein